MKSFYTMLLGAALLLFSNNGFSQAEAELNDSRSTANFFLEGTSINGIIGPGTGSGYDYFMGILGTSGRFVLYYDLIPPPGGADTGDRASIFVKDKNGRDLSAISISTMNGRTTSDSIVLCCQPSDTIYFLVRSFADFRYKLRYKGSSSPTETEPNNSLATPNSLIEGTNIVGNMGPGDIDDYFIGVPHCNGTATFKVYYANISGNSGADLYMYIYSATGVQIGADSALNVGVGPSSSFSGTVPCHHADTIYFRLNSSFMFSYSASFKIDCDSTQPPQACLSIVTDNSWSQSTTITPSNLSGNWNGVNNLPAAATFTDPVDIGQPYGFASINPIQNTEVISTGSNIRYIRREFILTDAANANVRLLTTVDDQADIYINGQRVALVASFGRSNFKYPAHDAKYNSNGRVNNGFMGGDSYDATYAPNIASLLNNGFNEVIIAVRNLAKANDKGGISFRMDINCSDISITKKSAVARLNNTLVLFPNPTKGDALISSELAVTSILVFDLSGKLLSISEHNAEKEVHINMANLASGVYLVQVHELGGEITTLKVIRK